jgi:hypothetical protein
MSEMGLGRVKTFSCRRSELDEVATRAIFPDFDYALIADRSSKLMGDEYGPLLLPPRVQPFNVSCL